MSFAVLKFKPINTFSKLLLTWSASNRYWFPWIVTILQHKTTNLLTDWHPWNALHDKPNSKLLLWFLKEASSKYATIRTRMFKIKKYLESWTGRSFFRQMARPVLRVVISKRLRCTNRYGGVFVMFKHLARPMSSLHVLHHLIIKCLTSDTTWAL